MTTAHLHHRSCNLCEAMCGIVVEHDGTDVLAIRGDPDDAFSRGHICPKAVALRDIYRDPDRLRTPLRRCSDGVFRPVGWDDALDEAAERLAAIAAAHGDDAVAIYQGNPSVHQLGTMLFGPAFARTLRTKNRFSATSVDQLPHHFVAYHLFGHQLLMPVPDVDRTDHLLVLGANPLVSNGSIMSAPGMKRRLRELRARGGRLVVVDPRRTETAAVADAHHFIRPGGDALLLAAMITHLRTRGQVRLGRLDGHVAGVDALLDALARFTPAAVAEAVGIDADVIAAMADDFAAAERPVCYARLGVCTGPFGALGVWLAHALTALVGSLDSPGGLMFTSPAVDVVAKSGRGGFGRWHSRVRGLPEVGGELPVVTLSEEIETEGPGQIRALVTSAGNPVLSTPDGRRLDRALATLDFMVSIDIYRNETTRHAHLILPPKTGLEVPHYDLAFHALAVRNTARFADALFAGHPDGRADWQIFAGLSRRLIARRGGARGPIARRIGAIAKRSLSPTLQLDFALRTGPYGGLGGRRGRHPGAKLSVAALRDAPHGVDLGPLVPRLPERLFTASGKVELAPRCLLDDLERLADSLERGHGGGRAAGPTAPTDPAAGGSDHLDELLLIGRRGLADCNSWMHNAEVLMGGRARCTLMMHPADAAARGIDDGVRVLVRSRVGVVEVPVTLTDGVMRGVVSLPHGYGHDRDGVALRVARRHAGASFNDLADAEAIDGLTGNAALNGVAVRVSALAPAPAG